VAAYLLSRKFEFTKKRVIIRNVPDCEFYKGMVKAYFISTAICESEEDINIMKSGTSIINKNPKPCDCTSFSLIF